MSKRAALIAVGSVVGVGALALIAHAASKGDLFGPSVPIPSDEDLEAKYGVNATHNNILTFAQSSLKAMRILYATYTPNCVKFDEGTFALKPSGVSLGGNLISTFASKDPEPISHAIISLAGSIVSAIGSVFDHHAKAVAAEQSAICAGTYAANKTLDAIDAAIAAGNISRSDYQSAFQSLFEKLFQMTAHVAQGCPPTTATGAAAAKGNEACIVNRIFQAIAEKRLAQLGVAGGVA